jgi:ADP-heptose:LPS heptosyltransferase
MFVEPSEAPTIFISTLPAIQAFSRSYPDAKLTVLTFAPGGELSGNDLLIHRIVCVEKRAKHPHLARQAVVELLSQQQFALIV